MAQRLQGLTLGFLDLDNEERFIQKGDYTNALNIRRFSSSEGVAYPVKNVVGSVAVGNTLPSGTNTCIGQTVLEEVNTLYFAIHNSNGNHGLYQYNTITDTVTEIVQDSFLNFSLSKYITGFNAVNSIGGDGVLLYWTDNLNPPRKINVKRAILHNQGDFINGYATNFSSGTNSEKSIYYDAVKHPPKNPITFTFTKDPDVGINNINNRTFQFRYRYLYDDGERSAYAPWSKLAFSPLLRSNDTSTVNVIDDQFNAIFLSFQPPVTNNVERVELTVREGNGGDEFLWDSFDVNTGTNAAFFYNNSVQTAVGTEDSLKPYDAVPLLAKAQESYGNKLYYANTLDGYDQTTVLGSLTPIYNQGFSNLEKEDITASINLGNVQVGVIPILTLDLSNVSLVEGNTIVISFSFSTEAFSRINWIGASIAYTIQASDIDPQVGRGNNTQGNVFNKIIQLITNYNYPSSISSNFDNIYGFKSGNSIKIYFSGDGVVVRNAENLRSDSYAVKSAEGVSTHKGGSFHPYGVVYYDRAGRSSTVNKLGSEYVKFYSERDDSEREFDGAVDMAVSIRNTPPIWATHYQIVYSGNRSIDEYLQYTCAGVFKGKDQTSGGNNFDRVYLSLRNFQGDSISWKESTGALPQYNYVDGDRIRVWEYYDNDTGERVSVQGNLDFKVVDYVFLPKDSTNPIYDNTDATTQARTSGWFLIIEDPKINGWDVASISNAIANNRGNWYNGILEVDQGAYFEIYRPKANTDDLVYYEVGDKYEIGDAGLSTRYHTGGVRNQNETNISYTADANVVPVNFVDIQEPLSSVKIVEGDTINSLNGLGNVIGTHQVIDVDIDVSDNTQARLYTDTPVPVAVAQVNLVTTGSAVSISTSGDSYYKPRVFFEGRSIVSFKGTIVGVEDYYLNDFISLGNSWDRGRVNAFSEEQRQLRRPSTVWVSEAFSPDTNYNGLSAFNLSTIPYRDYPQRWGGIQVMKQNNQGIILWQEDKTSKILIDRSVIESAEGSQTITVSNDNLGQFIPYKGDYGVAQQPESLFGNDGDWYWTDIKRGAVLRLANDGLTPISDYKARQYFYNESREYLSNYAQSRIVGGYDTRNDEAIWTWPQITATDVTANGFDLNSTIPNGLVSGGNLEIPVEITYKEPVRLSYSTDPRNWEDRIENWEDRFAPLYTTDNIAETGGIDVSFDDIEEGNIIPAFLTLNTASDDLLTFGSVNVSQGALEVPTTNPDYPTLTSETTIVKEGFTVAFYEPANRWSTFYSYAPEMYSSLNGNFYTFNLGGLNKMNEGSAYNNFFGVQYNSQLTPVINEGPFEVKSFYAAWIEGNSTWDIDITTNINGKELLSEDFVLKEGRYYQQLPFSNTGTTDSNVIGLGDVSGIVGNVVTISGFNASGSGIFVGDTVLNTSGSIGTITAIEGATITLSSVSGLSSGDFIYVQRNGFTDGDRIRGVYAELAMTNEVTDSEVELYSVDLNSGKSFR